MLFSRQSYKSHNQFDPWLTPPRSEWAMKPAIVSVLLVASLPAFAQSDMFERDRQLYESKLAKAERDLAFDRAFCDLARKDPSSAACERLQRTCMHALESGVEDGVRHSYGCKD
jgi:hypothetical protein